MIRSYPSPDKLCVYLLGTLRIERDGQAIRLPTRKIESLFAYLVLHPDPHTRDKLVAMFWGDSSDEAARGSLRHALTCIRRQVDKGIILADRECVQINPAFRIWVDINEFKNQAEQFLSGNGPQPDQFDVGLYRGDLLDEFYDDWIEPLREHTEEQYLDVMLRIVEQLRARSEYDLAIAYAQQILAIDAANERAHQHLMFCYVTLGNRNKAMQQYDACRRALQEELDVEPASETQALYHWTKASVTSVPSQAAKITNLPIPISSFVGRASELIRIKQLLSRARLVTLTGAGGCGKTRLAIHVATDLIDSYKDGVWWVELAPLLDTAFVPSAVAKALGVITNTEQTVTEAIIRFLQKRQLLLALDNCEHLIAAAAELAEQLLTSSPGLTILATSREALGIMGENVWVVPTLTIPKAEEITLVDLLMQYEGIRLFVERTNAVKPDYILSEGDALAVAQICQHLDGIPLAIELAAARMKMMPAEQIAARLDDRFNLLTAGFRTVQERHRTLRAVVDWSYNLLAEDEQHLLCRLSVFSGGWTIEAAEVVCSGDGLEKGRILELLGHLVDKSLISLDERGGRYAMLETLKQYGEEKLTEAGIMDWVVERHLDYFLEMARPVEEKIQSPEKFDWIERLRPDYANLTIAMDRSLCEGGNIEKGIKLVCALNWYLNSAQTFYVTIYWLKRAVKLSERLGRTATRAEILYQAVSLSEWALFMYGPSEAQALIEESLRIWEELGPAYQLEQGKSLLVLGCVRARYFTDESGFDMIRKSRDIFRELDSTWWQGWSLVVLEEVHEDINSPPEIIRPILEEEAVLWRKMGWKAMEDGVMLGMGLFVDLRSGDLLAAEKHLRESLSACSEWGGKGWRLRLYRGLGTVYRGLNRYEQAEACYKQSISDSLELGWERMTSRCYFGLGMIALHRGDDSQAAVYLHQALDVAMKNNMTPSVVYTIAGFACLAVFRKELLLAARLFGTFQFQAEALCAEVKRTKFFDNPVDTQEIEHYLESCQEQLGEAEFEAALDAGKALSVDEVIAEILAEGEE